MKKSTGLLCALLVLTLALNLPLTADAYTMGDPWDVDLSVMVDNPENRRYAEIMLDYYLRNDTRIQKTLEDGYSAMFLFEGCSDNMDTPELADLSFYRVTACCFVVRLDENGEPCIVYFNENCSTIPDRPLEYGATYKEEFGEVGPATICDGTYDLFSVKHMGKYEALHLRDSLDDGEIPAVYMFPEGYMVLNAEYINIHTRTSNHTSGLGMWSAGCMLIGDGGFHEFEEMMDCTYYTIYEEFDIGNRVGTVTINRANLDYLLLNMYENPGAVDTILTHSRCILPEVYLQQCRWQKTGEPRPMRTALEVSLMSLPCGNDADARSVALATLSAHEEVTVTGALINTRGNTWYAVEWEGQTGFLYSPWLEEIPESSGNWFVRLWEKLFG